MIRVTFLGSHPLGERSLERLVDHPEVSVETVVTYPAGYDSWWDGSVRETARRLGLDCPIFSLDEERGLLSYPTDYLVSVYYPNVLDEELLSHPAELPLNLHQAELPRYRGSNVFSHAIMNARDDNHWRYGTTLHVMAPTVDAGDVIDRRFVDIRETDTARSLYERTCEASVDLFEATLPAVVSGDVHEMRTSQSTFDGERYFYRKSSLDGEKYVPPERVGTDDVAVYDRIRALDFPPFEPAYTRLNDERVYLTLSQHGETA